MRMRALLASLLASGLVAAGPAPSTVSESTATAAHTAIVDALLDGDVDQAMISSLVAMGGDRTAVAALLEGAESEQLLPAGDLDGDGLPDVIGLGREARQGQTTAPDVDLTVTARSGLTGDELWSTSALGSTATVQPTPTGVVLVTLSHVGAALTQQITVFDHDGTVRWERSDVGIFTGAYNVRWPFYAGTIDDGDSLAHVVSLINYSYLWGDVSEPGQLVVDVVADADGSTIGTIEHQGEGFPWAWAAPDLDGDGDGDILITQAYAFGTSGDVVATTVDGTSLWSTTAPFRSNGFLVWPGDATGDGVDDVAIGADSHSVALVSGADGTTAWDRPGEWPSLIGDVDSDGLPDVGARTIENLNFSELVTDHGGYNGAGDLLYREATSIPIEPGRGYESLTTTYLITADVDGDGSQDTFHDFDLTYSDGERVRDVGATSGRDGRRLWDRSIPLMLGGSVQGPGVDLADIRTNSTTAFVEVLRGDTLQQVWRVGIPGGGTLDSAVATAVDVDADGLGDVVVTIVIRGANGTLIQHGYVLDGRDGSIRW